VSRQNHNYIKTEGMTSSATKAQTPNPDKWLPAKTNKIKKIEFGTQELIKVAT
jgi:hypothetical protein